MSRATILDGGMGQELLHRTGAKPTPLWSAQVLHDHPEAVRAVHDDYFAAGAEIATTNTYSVLHDRLEAAGLDHLFAELHARACGLAADARDANGGGRVAGSLGPLGWSYCPDLAPPWEEAAEIYSEIVRLQDSTVDLFIIETMSSVDQARGALAGAAAGTKPVWLAVSVDDAEGARLRSGEAVTDILPLLGEFRVDALLVNCSSPDATTQALEELPGPGIKLGAYANGFKSIPQSFMNAGAVVDVIEVRDDLDPVTYAGAAEGWIAAGAAIVGGCCEIGPAHIRELAHRFGSAPCN